jgi:large subunit ribosomal protein L17
MVEKLITLGKKDILHNRRQILQVLYDEKVAKKVFEVYGPKYKERKGGYTRITLLPTRLGDGAEMAVLELVD